MKSILSIVFCFFFILIEAQEALYMPREFQKAYQNDTRSLNGKPGKNYWQNQCTYSIDVEVIPGTWKVIGSQTITYKNNSPDSLYKVYIKMHPNHYKRGALRANEIPVENLTNGMQISSLVVNGKKVPFKNTNKSTNLAPENVDNINYSSNISVTERSSFIRLNLKSPIPPNSTFNITIDWITSMPSTYVNRIGAYDDNSAFVGYWYPQIAVYDDIDGWDDSEYTGAHEYYLDYSNYEVNITVPKNYKIAATGQLLNPEEVLEPAEFKNYQVAKSAFKPVIITEGKDVKSDEAKNTWKFKATNVRDFAFGLSDNFKWVGQSVKLKSKIVSSNIIYNLKDEKYAENVLAIQNKSLVFLSEDYPGIPFPYDTFTTYIGVPEFDGMEFPMMANNGFSKNVKSNTYMTFHEASHTYFPHYVGVNEIKYSWMEEGWATFFTIKFIQDLYKGTEDEDRQLKKTIRGYLVNAGKQWESPLIAPTNHLTIRKGHFQLSYRKPAFMLLALESLIGESVFKSCLKEYINRWKGKHPTPYDFMFTFNDVSRKNLNWFWNKWVFQYGYADLALKEVSKLGIIIDNKGGLPVPIKLQLIDTDGKVVIIEKTPEIWSSNSNTIIIKNIEIDKLTSVELLSDAFPDTNTKDNLLVLKNK
ncbi:M1 family metallopeptidase [Hyunsoonleella pacifica]|uniref:M1 family peptidase n=1 Tax=Hyunsoonleella pacifica TaxID=1080224 RepID=A0A4Q9FVY3_9FLAO|nr:M1 family metallopeptidase [Hyunsoonleella pacifica]TBN18765.1 M1 family peptidase [Hyunsoonleella pacifica]GGD04535.1 peptidase M1 [Hyunsoonleella pacifica]